MKTKAQKAQKIEEGIKIIGEKNTLIFADFTGTTVNDMNAFRKLLREFETKFEVVKKRLFRVILERSGFEFNPESLDGQLGVVYSNKAIDEIAGPVYKFAKGKKTFKILGALSLKDKKFIEGSEVEMIGKLPSRDVLIAQVVGTIAAPMSALLYVLSERAKKIQSN